MAKMIETTAVENKQFFDFDIQGCQAITLEQLARTYKENDVMGQPLRGIYHYALIQEIVRMANEQNYEVEIYDMFACKNKDRQAPGVVINPQIEELKGERAIEAHCLRRVYTNIRIKDFDDEELTTNLAVSYTQKGIQVGFGTNVKICHNQCMLSADRYASTFKNSRYADKPSQSIPEILDTVKSWLFDARHIVETDRERIAKMKEISLTPNQIYVMYGMLSDIRVRVDSKDNDIKIDDAYPLNQAQISRFIESVDKKYAEQGNVSVWDVYNSATDLYKADTLDMPLILPMNLRMCNFLETNFM